MPTACLDVDTFGWTSYRLKWAMLFDYVFTWHPSYVSLFRDMGHPNVHALPHAVDARLYAGAVAEGERPYDVGFVGNFGLPQYVTRDRVNSKLAGRFRTNDFRTRYDKKETAEVYEHSTVVVNVSRAEFPPEANMRCYEAMAGGALLITGVPTELTEWGFREGEHFIGWRSEDEIPGLVEQFLRCTKERVIIARAGQSRTLNEFTYQRCLATVSGVIGGNNGQLFAPARRWTAEAVHLLYLSYYHRLQLSDAALEEFRLLRRTGPQAYWKGLPMALKSLRHAVKSSLM
ncbi:MAG: glycosyltransferase [Candidatus Acidiferrales bacterium]